MGIKLHKPTTAGRRRSSVQTFDDITISKPYKKLVVSQKQQAGRSNGKITVRHRGGGAKRNIRLIDWKRDKFDIPAKVMTVEYDPNRGARISLVHYADGEKRYILAPQGIKVGQSITTSNSKGEPKVGNRFQLKDIPEGMSVYCVEMQPGKGAQIVKTAGSSAILLAIEGKHATLKLPSGEVRMVPSVCMASIGVVSNADWRLIRWGKAGRTRLRSIRPTVRGKAMNPVDHPHGGGEGRSPIGLKHPKTPTGKPALGVKTRSQKKPSDVLIVRRRNSKK
ncbi:50S ribosomal protein L2 [Patescibacteria group bacterium]|nr:50S ribosomal protein L2 [Patescibacteria group bacterium]